MFYLSRGLRRDEWGGSQAELEELAALPELALCEYKEMAQHMLGARTGMYGRGNRAAEPRWPWRKALPVVSVGAVVAAAAAWLVF